MPPIELELLPDRRGIELEYALQAALAPRHPETSDLEGPPPGKVAFLVACAPLAADKTPASAGWSVVGVK
jgi:hypothetical protein